MRNSCFPMPNDMNKKPQCRWFFQIRFSASFLFSSSFVFSRVGFPYNHRITSDSLPVLRVQIDAIPQRSSLCVAFAGKSHLSNILCSTRMNIFPHTSSVGEICPTFTLLRCCSYSSCGSVLKWECHTCCMLSATLLKAHSILWSWAVFRFPCLWM